MLGDMVYEMTRTFAHQPFMLDAHLDRLMASCRFTGIEPGLSRQEVEEVSLELLALNEPFVEPEVDLFIRHDISRGTMAHYERCVLPPQKPTAPGQATVIIACIPLIEYLGRAATYFDGGLHAVVPAQQAIPARYLDPKCKTRSRLHYQMANLQARRLDPEAWAVMVDEHGHIAEGTSSNFHIVKNGAIYTPQRVVEHLPERLITAAGVSSGIDMALRLVELLVGRQAAEASQLMIEYDPQPPFHAGAVGKASDATLQLALEYYGRRS